MGHAEPQVANALQSHWMPFTPNKEFKAEPRMVARAKGMYFYTADNRAIIDASSGLFCVAAGHCRDEISRAVYEQLQTLDFSAPFLRGHSKAFELAERISHYTPEGLNRILSLVSTLTVRETFFGSPSRPKAVSSVESGAPAFF